jgi:hypothetical protein
LAGCSFVEATVKENKQKPSHESNRGRLLGRRQGKRKRKGKQNTVEGMNVVKSYCMHIWKDYDETSY